MFDKKIRLIVLFLQQRCNYIHFSKNGSVKEGILLLDITKQISQINVGPLEKEPIYLAENLGSNLVILRLGVR